MNNYFTLRKANRLRVKLLTEKSQEQIREVVCYLRRISWDICGVELICSDLIDIAVQANKMAMSCLVLFLMQKHLCRKLNRV